jgi:hypothetical protein
MTTCGLAFYTFGVQSFGFSFAFFLTSASFARWLSLNKPWVHCNVNFWDPGILLRSDHGPYKTSLQDIQPTNVTHQIYMIPHQRCRWMFRRSVGHTKGTVVVCFIDTWKLIVGQTPRLYNLPSKLCSRDIGTWSPRSSVYRTVSAPSVDIPTPRTHTSNSVQSCDPGPTTTL